MGDDIKNHIAERVAQLLERESWAGPTAPEDIREISVTHPSPLQSQIRVATQNRGVHYFLVRVSEYK